MIDYEAAAGTAASAGNDAFLEGDCDCKLLIVDSRNNLGAKGNRYIIKVRVLEAKATGAIPAPPVGATRAVIINLDPPKNATQKDHGMGNLMNYAEGLNGGPMSGATPAEKGGKLKRLLGTREIPQAEAQRRGIAAVPFLESQAIGMVVGNRTVQSMTAGAFGVPAHPITYHNWYALPQTVDQVNERKAAIKVGAAIQWPPA